MPAESARLPADLLIGRLRRLAVADYLNRRLAKRLQQASGLLGTGHSGRFRILPPGQQVLERSSVRVSPDSSLEARFRARLPAEGRRVLRRRGPEMLTATVPELVRRLLLDPSLNGVELRRHVEVVEDAEALRQQAAAASAGRLRRRRRYPATPQRVRRAVDAARRL